MTLAAIRTGWRQAISGRRMVFWIWLLGMAASIPAAVVMQQLGLDALHLVAIGNLQRAHEHRAGRRRVAGPVPPAAQSHGAFARKGK